MNIYDDRVVIRERRPKKKNKHMSTKIARDKWWFKEQEKDGRPVHLGWPTYRDKRLTQLRDRKNRTNIYIDWSSCHEETSY